MLKMPLHPSKGTNSLTCWLAWNCACMFCCRVVLEMLGLPDLSRSCRVDDGHSVNDGRLVRVSLLCSVANIVAFRSSHQRFQGRLQLSCYRGTVKNKCVVKSKWSPSLCSWFERQFRLPVFTLSGTPLILSDGFFNEVVLFNFLGVI